MPFTIRETLERVSFVDEEGVLRKASTTGFLDPVEDHDAFIRRARLFEHLRACATYFNLGISKPNVKSARREAEGHKKKGATRIPPFHIHTHNVSPARVALRIAASRATSKVGHTRGVGAARPLSRKVSEVTAGGRVCD